MTDNYYDLIIDIEAFEKGNYSGKCGYDQI